MRQKRVIERKPGVRKAQSKEPIVEGIQKKAPRPRGFFTKMTDDELVSYAQKFIKEKNIKTRKDLGKADSWFCSTLRKRNLLDAVIPEKQEKRNWSSMTDEKLISFAKKFIEENGINSRSVLAKADFPLYVVLIKRNLLTIVIPKKQRKDWSSMTDEELISSAKAFIKENQIKSIIGLQKAANGLYKALWKRNLLNIVIPRKRKIRNWSSLTDDKLISFAKTYIEENAIKNRVGLQKVDAGLYHVLRKRNLLGLVIPEKQHKDWSSMNNAELISYAKKFIEENEIKNRSDLDDADANLYQILRRRNLLNTVIPKKYGRDWSSMTDKELIQFAKKFIEENGINRIIDLRKTDLGLYLILRRRKLAGVLFSGKQRNRRNWASMPDEEIVTFAEKFVEENGIKNRHGLEKADLGLYLILRRRNLLNLVFSDIEEAKKTEAVKQVVDAMKEF